jgi:uncharacterized membrane protein
VASPDGSDEPEALRNVGRLTYFSDAVIAIAVTLLVLPLVEASSDRASSLRGLLEESGGELFVFVLSFVVICRFWLVHHDMFRTLRTFDGRLFWFNALWLLSIVVLPYATESIGRPGGDRAVVTGVHVGSQPPLLGAIALAPGAREVSGHRAPDDGRRACACSRLAWAQPGSGSSECVRSSVMVAV